MITQIITIALASIAGGVIGYLLFKLCILTRDIKTMIAIAIDLEEELSEQKAKTEFWMDYCIDLETKFEFPDFSDIKPDILNINDIDKNIQKLK